MVHGFDPPPGDGDAAANAATLFGTVGGDLTGDIHTVKGVVNTAMAKWKAPRALDFHRAAFGIQTELILVTDAAHQVATVATQFSRAWKAADEEIAGYRTEAVRLDREVRAHPNDPASVTKSLRIAALRDKAGDARHSLDKLAGSLAATIDAYTDRLVPGGSKLSPADLRRRVDAASGAGLPPATDPKSAWKVVHAAAKQGKQVLDLTEDNKDGEKVGGPVTSLPVDPQILKALLDAARSDGITPPHYAGLLHQFWVAKAAHKAGIDLNAWDPSKGTDSNLSTISAVYTYYGKLFLHDPSKLQWAGMANMIGPSFAGGFQDIAMMKQLASHVLGPAEDLPDWAKGMLPPPLSELDALGHASAHELNYFETKFLAMQKHIFFDQASMHEAYVEGGDRHGLANIREMRAAGLIDDKAMTAWTDIDSGDPARIKTGNTLLLDREQNQVINKQYDDMRNYHGPVGEAFTYLMTAAGSASIPGTKTPAEYSPLTFTVKGEAPGIGPEGEVKVQTSLPDFNVSDRADRWKYVTQDTLPAYQKLLAEHPDEARRIIGSDVDQRIADQRLTHRWPGLVADLATEWDIDAKVGEHIGPLHLDIKVPFL